MVANFGISKLIAFELIKITNTKRYQPTKPLANFFKLESKPLYTAFIAINFPPTNIVYNYFKGSLFALQPLIHHIGKSFHIQNSKHRNVCQKNLLYFFI